MARLRTITLSLLLAGSMPVQARKAEADSNYVRTFPQTITLRTYLGEKVSVFTLEDSKSDRKIIYHPNNSLGLGVGITLFGIGVNFSTAVPFRDRKIDMYGRTKKLDIQTHRYSRKLMLDAYVQQYQGFHLNETDDVTAVTGPEQFPYFPDLKTLSIGVTGLYVFNGEKYSLRVISNQQEWQLRSSGSPLLGASVFTHFFKDDTGVLPPLYKHNDFLGGRHPKEIDFYGLLLHAGYGYTLVLDPASHYFIAGAADVGAGPGYSAVTDLDGAELNKFSYNLAANLRIGGGYNSQKWYAGVYGIFHGDRFELPYDKSIMTTGQGLVRFVVARRIVTKKKWLAKQPKPFEPASEAVPEPKIQID